MKNKGMKKAVMLLLDTVLIVSLMVAYYVPAFADSAVHTSADGKYLYQVLNNGTITICSGGQDVAYLGTDTVLTIPSVIDGYSVSKIGARAFRGCILTDVTIPEGVSTIDNAAFMNCSSLQRVVLPNSVRTIAYAAFLNCTSLSDIQLPEGVLTLSVSAFNGCRSLKDVVIPSSVTSISNQTFANCTSLETVTIPETVTSIDDTAFNGCNSLAVIYGAAGSYAETFANSKGIDFVDILTERDNYVYTEPVTVQAGEDVTVAFKLKNNQGFIGFEAFFDYDSTVFTPQEVISSDAVLKNGLLNDTIGSPKFDVLRVIWSGNSSSYDDGILFSVRFSVSSEASGVFPITISFDEDNTFDEDFNTVEFDCDAAQITVENQNESLPIITLECANSIVAGNEFSITGTLSELTGTEPYAVSVSFNDNSFEFISADAVNGSAISNVLVNDGVLSFDISGLSAAQNSKEVFTLTFRCFGNAKRGDYAFNASCVGIRINNVSVNVSQPSANQVITVDCPDVAASIGDQTVEMTISLLNNQGLMGCKLNIAYDPEVLEPVEADTAFEGTTDNNIGLSDDNFDVLWYADNENNSDGDFITVEFRILSTSYETSSVEISYSPESTFNEAYELVELDCKTAQVTVNALIGDVDLNGVVDVNDVGLVMSMSVESIAPTKSQSMLADVNKDGAIDAFDAAMIDRIMNNN